MATMTRSSDTSTSARSAVATATGLVVLRVVLGAVMIVHGWQKFFVDGISGVSGFFGQMGVPLAGFSAAAVATVAAPTPRMAARRDIPRASSCRPSVLLIVSKRSGRMGRVP